MQRIENNVSCVEQDVMYKGRRLRQDLALVLSDYDNKYVKTPEEI
jgi:hypothetical protein